MKKILLALTVLVTVTVSTNAMAWGYRGGYRGGYHGGGGFGWVAPLAIGGVIGYELARPAPVVVESAPVVIQQAPVVTYIQQTPQCPQPYQPYYNLVWTHDAYGNQIQEQQFAGCR
jgi:hypothetical protein